MLKSHVLEICRLILTADGNTQMQFLNHSEVRFLCVRLLCFPTWVWNWCLDVEKYGYFIGPYPTFKFHRTANPYAIPMRTCRGAPNTCSMRWLACVSNNLCMQQPLLCEWLKFCLLHFCAYVCSDVIWTAILNWGLLKPRPYPLARWTRIFHIQRHLVWEGVMRINITPLISMQ